MTANINISTAVILAAGRGTRLKKTGESIPKGFIQVQDRPIIEESLERLFSIGIKEVIIVTGHLAEFYEDLAQKYSSVRTVYNASYAKSGSMHSLFQLNGILNEDFILLESDLVYEIRALRALVSESIQDCVLISGITKSKDEVWVSAPGGKLVGLSKQRDKLSDIHGELVGITRVSMQLFNLMCNIAKRYFTKSLHMEYETALASAAQEYYIHCLKIDDLVWAEIDTEEHLDRVRKKIYPKLNLQK